MDVGTFIHSDDGASNTLSEIKRVNELVGPCDFIGLYAYATQSGVASFELEMGSDFWEHTPTRWLFGLDYGRTQPQAIRRIAEKANAQVRIADGAWIVNQEGFLPRRDYHLKASFLLNIPNARFGMVVGSGNFSSNGLRKSIEAGAVLYTENQGEYTQSFEAVVGVANALWDQATPAEEILEAYEERWLDSFSRRGGEVEDIQIAVGEGDIFWIEAGYVTQNRGENRPGNQIDFPRGMSKYFGFNPPADLPVNSVIGAVTFQAPIGDLVTRNLRLGNNHMEKVSLPIPESHGFGIYDGKVLVFRRLADRFEMSVLEVADFEGAFGDRLSAVRTMASGRRYGHLT